MRPLNTSTLKPAKSSLLHPAEQDIRSAYMRHRTITPEALEGELRRLYRGILYSLSYYVLDHAFLQAYGFAFADEVTEEALDLRKFIGANDTLSFRDYAIDGRVDPVEVTGYWEGCACFVWSAIGQMYGTGEVDPPVLSMRVLDQGAARLKLDRATKFPSELDHVVLPAQLTLQEIALLAGMTERAVRNATLASAPDRLRTTELGKHRVVVEPEEALRWLRGRRGFTETEQP